MTMIPKVAAILRDEIDADRIRGLIASIFEAAADGDMRAVKICFDLLATPAFEFHGVLDDQNTSVLAQRNLETKVAYCERLTAMALNGEVSPKAAKMAFEAVRLIADLKTADDVEEIRQQLDAYRARQQENMLGGSRL